MGLDYCRFQALAVYKCSFTPVNDVLFTIVLFND